MRRIVAYQGDLHIDHSEVRVAILAPRDALAKRGDRRKGTRIDGHAPG